MKRLSVCFVCLLLAFAAACSKKATEPESAAPAPEASAAPAGGPSPEAAPPAEPRTIEITDGLVQKYMEYKTEQLALLKQYVAESRKNLESAKGDTAKTLNQIAINDRLGKEMEAKLAAKKTALGLGDEEFAVVKDAAEALAVGRGLYLQMGGDAQLAKMEADQKAEIARMPAEQRAAAEAQMASMTKSLRDVRDGLDLRKKYGDQSTDVLLKYADQLAAQYTEGLKSMAGKK